MAYNIEPFSMGGGGYITGLVQDQIKPNRLYARCDVAGIFRSDDRGKTFRAMNKGMEACHHHSVQSFALGNINNELILRCSGEARNNKLFGHIHKSLDGGETWEVVASHLDFYGNGPTRRFGEVIDIDPFNNRHIIVGAYSKGLYESYDEGISWKCLGFVGERISLVKFDPYVEGRYVVGTIGDKYLEKDLMLDDYQDFKRYDFGSLFIKEKDRDRCHVILEEADIMSVEITKDLLIVASNNKGILVYEFSSRRFENRMNGLDRRVDYHIVSLDHRNKCLYTVPDLRGCHDFIDPIPIYQSLNYGLNWELITTHDEASIYNYPDYMDIKRVGWAVSKLLVDAEDSGQLYLSNWYGVSISYDHGKTFTGNGFHGLETTCCEGVYMSEENGDFYVLPADHAPVIINEEEVRQLPKLNGINNSTAVATSKYDDNFIIWAGRRRDKKRQCEVFASFNKGITGKSLLHLDGDYFVQAIKEDIHEKGSFYVYIEGPFMGYAGLYKFCNFGETILKCQYPLGQAEHLPIKYDWVNREVMSVVVYQDKNVCGSNKLLAIDPFTPRTLYLGEWTSGLFKSIDGGYTWSDISSELPFFKSKYTTITCVVCHPNVEGLLFAGFIGEGLYKSVNGGQNWQKVALNKDIRNINDISFIDNETLIVVSEPLYWSPQQSNISIINIYTCHCDVIDSQAYGALRWKGISYNQEKNMGIGVTCGNGAYKITSIR